VDSRECFWPTPFSPGSFLVAPAELPRLEEIHLDARAVLFVARAAAGSTVLAALVPIGWARRSDPHTPLRGGARAGPERPGACLGKQALVVWQVALALVVATGAGLLAGTLWNLQRAEMGFVAQELTVAAIAHPRWPGDREAVLTFYDELVERVEAFPGVEAATPVILSPFSGEGGWNAVYTLEDRETGKRRTTPV
jgi:putative ABC transport system permease protein